MIEGRLKMWIAQPTSDILENLFIRFVSAGFCHIAESGCFHFKLYFGCSCKWTWKQYGVSLFAILSCPPDCWRFHLYSGLNSNQDKATKPQTVQIVRQGEVTPYWFKVNPLYFLNACIRLLRRGLNFAYRIKPDSVVELSRSRQTIGILIEKVVWN